MKSIFYLIYFSFSIQVYSQSLSLDSLQAAEDSLKFHFEYLGNLKDDTLKKAYNQKVIDIIEKILPDQQSFTYPFSSLKSLSIVQSKDELVRIYAWNLAFNDGTYLYFGYVQHINKKKKTMKVFRLTDKSAEMEIPEPLMVDNEHWFGALYYQIVGFNDGSKDYYMLMGWDGNNDFTTKKIIDVLSFTGSGKPVFGASVFKVENTRTKRIVFEYAKRAKMVLHYDEDTKMIVFDRLAPAEPKFKGQFQYYGPGVTYDALVLKNGKWTFIKDIDARNPKEKTTKKIFKYNN